MEVILLEKVQNLGAIGDKVNVRPGFGRNYLIPRGKAVSATAENIKVFEARKAELLKAEAEALSAAQARQAKINGQTISISAKVGDEGKLFGSIGTVDIVEAMSKAGMTVQKHEVRLPTGPLRVVGEHEVALHLHPDVDTAITVKVVAEE